MAGAQIYYARHDAALMYLLAKFCAVGKAQNKIAAAVGCGVVSAADGQRRGASKLWMATA